MNIMKVIFITKMRWSKFSIPNCDPWKVCNDTNNIKDSFYLNPWAHIVKPLTSKCKKETCGNYVACCVCQTKGFSWSIDHTYNYWNNCSSFFKFEISTSSINTTCWKKRSLYSIVSNYVDSLAWMKWFYICNKGHTILASYFATILVGIEFPTKF